jgi:TPR repeat protein
MAWNQGFSDQENLQWSMLRAIEWGIWPAFLSQSIVPPLLIAFEWWEVIGVFIVLTILWSFVRYRYVNVAMARFGVFFVLLKWITIPAAVVYLLIQQNYISAVVALLWPIFLAPYLGIVIGGTKIGKIQEMFMAQLGYSAKQSPESGVTDDTHPGVRPMVDEDYSLDCLIQRAAAASPTGEVSPATRKRLETLSRELEEVNKKLEEHQETQAWKEAQRAVDRIKEDVAREERKVGRKRTQAELGAEFDGLVKDIDKFLAGVNDDTHQGVPQDRTQTAAWFKEGKEHWLQFRAAEAAACFKPAAERGHAEAQYLLSCLYHSGRGVPQDDMQSVEWCRKAAGQGILGAQLSLAVMYAEGQGVLQDYTQAAFWYRKAAEQGSAKAQYNLGDLYDHGQGVPQDYAQATFWWRKAAEQGHADAQFFLGGLYHDGQGVSQDDTQAAAWWRKAAEQGFSLAQYHLGLSYDKGLGVPQDYTQAALWYRKAAGQSVAEAQCMLGAWYGMGQGVPQDYAEAYFWSDVAAAGKLDASMAEAATTNRDLALSHLTSASLAHEQERVRNWFEAHPAKHNDGRVGRRQPAGYRRR